MEHSVQHGKAWRMVAHFGRQSVLGIVLLLAACGTGGDSGSEPNTPLTRPMALVVNQDDTTLTTIRLDGKGPPVVGTLSLGPAQPDAIGGVSFSLGEWIFVTHTAQNRVATIDPIGATAPILESFLTENPLDARVRIGQRPTRIYRDPVDKEVLWTMNDGDPVTGLDTVANCAQGGSVSVLHNSHLGVGGERPRVTSVVCLSGTGEHLIAFSRPPVTPQEIAFVSSKTTGLISVLLPVQTAGGGVAWSEFFVKIDLCDSAKETSLGYPACDASAATPNHSAPAGMFWSRVTGKIYVYLSGYDAVAEIDPNALTTRQVDITPPINAALPHVSMTPDGRFLFLVGEDVLSNPSMAIGKMGIVDLTAANPALTMLSVPELDNIRPTKFQFAPDGRRLYLVQSNRIDDLPFAAQAHNLKSDKLLVFDPSSFPSSPTFIGEIDLPAVGPDGLHGMDLWIVGPRAASSTKGIVVTNATPGARGSVSLIDAASNAVTATIPVGRNPQQVTVYYYGLAARDNQATPIW